MQFNDFILELFLYQAEPLETCLKISYLAVPTLFPHLWKRAEFPVTHPGGFSDSLIIQQTTAMDNREFAFNLVSVTPSSVPRH